MSVGAAQTGAEEAPFICGAGVNTLKWASGMSSVFVINKGLMDAAILGASYNGNVCVIISVGDG